MINMFIIQVYSIKPARGKAQSGTKRKWIWSRTGFRIWVWTGNRKKRICKVQKVGEK